MKKIYTTLVLLFAMTFVNGQNLQLNTPDFAIECDNLPQDGVALFNLTLKNQEILGNLSSTEYSITYFENISDAEMNTNSINDPESYTSILNWQLVYARGFSNINPNEYGIVELYLYVDSLNEVKNFATITEFLSDSSLQAVFDLSSKNDWILNGYEHNVEYFASENDAIQGINLITNFQNYYAFDNTNVYLKITNSNNCSKIALLSLQVENQTNVPIINTPADEFFCNNGNGVEVDFTQFNQEILGSNNSLDYDIKYFLNFVDAEQVYDVLPSSYTLIETNTIYARVSLIDNPNIFAITPFQIIIQEGVNVTSAYNINIQETNFDGFSSFNLSNNNSVNPNYNTTYFHTENDANNNVNSIQNVTTYLNTTNPETVFRRVENIQTNCYIVDSFILNVLDLANAPVINTPLDKIYCNSINLNFETINQEIIGSNNPNDIEIKYFLSLNDAEQNNNWYLNHSFDYTTTVYARASSINDLNNYSIVQFQIIIQEGVNVTSANNIYIQETNFDGFSSFNLSNSNSVNPNYITTYFHTENDANNNVNSIQNVTAYLNTTNPEIVFRRVKNIQTNCYIVDSFILKVLDLANAPVINTPSNLVVCDLDSNYYEAANLHQKDSEILGTLDPATNFVYYYISQLDLENDFNRIDYYSISYNDYPTFYVKVQNSLGYFATTTLQTTFLFNALLNSAQNLTYYEANAFDSIGEFNLTLNTPIILGSNSLLQVKYYLNQIDAETDTNYIENPIVYTNTSNNQLIWYRVLCTSGVLCTSSNTMGSFQLIVSNLNCNEIVTIPNVNFKLKLLQANSNNQVAKDLNGNWTTIDTNFDGLIQKCEAENISELFLGSSSDIIGIISFTNLKKLNLDGFYLGYWGYFGSEFENFDVSNMPLLESVSMLYGFGQNFNFSNCPNLKYIKLGGVSQTEMGDSSFYSNPILNLLNSPNIEELYVSYFYLTTLDFSGLQNLKKLDVSCTFLPQLDLSNLNNLQELTAVGIGSITDVSYYYPGRTFLTNVKLPESTGLQKINLSNNYIQEIEIKNCPNLNEVLINHGYSNTIAGLKEIKIQNCPSISKLQLAFNQLKDIDLSGLINLSEIDLKWNKLEIIDLSNNSLLNKVDVSNNENLKYINVNNAANESQFVYMPNQNLKYICADTVQIPPIQYYINSNNLYDNLFVGNICSNSNNYIEINIPDVNFKNKLIQIGVDANSDGKIQYSEAFAQTQIDVSNANIQNIEGIQWFKNLIQLNFSNNQVVEVKYIKNLYGLQNLNCSNNNINYLVVTKLVNLQNINFSNNSCVFIDLSKLLQLQTINASNNQLRQIYFNNGTTETSIDFSGNPKLHTITTDSNQNAYFTTLYPNALIDNISQFEDGELLIEDPIFIHSVLYGGINKSKALNTLALSVPVGGIDNRMLTYNGLQQFKNLETLDATTYWEPSGWSQNNTCVEKEYINQLIHLENLTYSCEYGILDDFTPLTKLKTLNLHTTSSNLQNIEINLNSCINLQTFNLECIWCYQNSNLENLDLLVGNGANETININVGNVSTMSNVYFCADDFQVATLQTQFPSANINTYCSFIPGGNYNTIQGTSVFDNELDGCDINDEIFEHLRLDLTNGTINASTFTDVQGNYKFYPNAGTFTMTPHLENPTYYSVTPTSVPVNFANNLNNITNQYFCITPNGVHNDVEIVLAQVTPARPGFDAEYSLVYKNKGNQPLSGAVSVTFDDTKLDFVSSSLPPTTQIPNTLTWNYTNLLPFENRSITFTLNVNSPMETPAVNNGDILTFNATITPLAGDEIPADNSYAYNQTVVGSFDPNDIYCLEGESLDPSMIGNYLHYNVRFENTGTFEAENIVVATTIDPNDYDLSTLQVLNASHNVYTRIKNNKVEFIFENINLAATSGNPPVGGHGTILFKMKSKSTLQVNDDVTSKANIFFDYNFPIETNDATTVFEALNNQDFTKDETVKIYPNPANSIVSINSNFNIKSVELYDVQGRILEKIFESTTSTTLNLSERQSGIYFVKITSDKGSKVEKIVKN